MSILYSCNIANLTVVPQTTETSLFGYDYYINLTVISDWPEHSLIEMSLFTRVCSILPGAWYASLIFNNQLDNRSTSLSLEIPIPGTF